MGAQGKLASAWTWAFTSSNGFLSVHSEKLHLAVTTLLSKITSSGILPAEGYQAAGHRESPQACKCSAFWTQSALIFGNPRPRSTLQFSPGASLNLLQVCPNLGYTRRGVVWEGLAGSARRRQYHVTFTLACAPGL